MNSVLDDLRENIKNGGRDIQLILALVGIYAVLFIISIAAPSTYTSVVHQLTLSPEGLLYKPWTLLTHGAIQTDFISTVLNGVTLYYCSKIYLSFGQEKQIIPLFLLGAVISGAAFYLLSIISPATAAANFGPKAGIAAIFFAAVSYSPQYQIKLALFGFVRLYVLGGILVTLFVVSSLAYGPNHAIVPIIGAVVGYLYPYINWSKFSSFTLKRKKKSPLSVIKGGQYINTPTSSPKRTIKSDKKKLPSEARMNMILDKIKHKGIQSLTKEEKLFLDKMSQK